jgi:hypothetical protein
MRIKERNLLLMLKLKKKLSVIVKDYDRIQTFFDIIAICQNAYINFKIV